MNAPATPRVASQPPVCAIDWFESPVGPLVAGATSDAICLLEFSDRDLLDAKLAALRKRYSDSLCSRPSPTKVTPFGGRVERASAAFDQKGSRWLGDLRRQLEQYFRGERRDFDLPLLYPGSSFQEQVWSILREIPYGQTWSYLDVATRLGDVKATRAVGAANGANPIAIVIPCHRVINANGDLGGYGGGLGRKRILLDLENGQGRMPF